MSKIGGQGGVAQRLCFSGIAQAHLGENIQGLNQATVKGGIARLLGLAQRNHPVHAQGQQTGGIHLDAADAVQPVGGGGGVVRNIVDKDIQPFIGIPRGNLGGGIFRLPKSEQGLRLCPLRIGEGAVTDGGGPGGLVEVIAHPAVALGTNPQR